MSETPETTTPATLSPDESNWAVFGHLAALVGFVIPFGSNIGPLVILLTKGKESDFIADQARESLNFQITMLLAFLVCFVLAFVFIGFLLMGLLAVADLILIILAAVAASKGERYRYPATLRLVK